MAINKQSKSSTVASATQLIAGTTKHLAGTTQVVLGGSTFTPAQINDKLQAIVNLRNDVQAAKASTKAKLVAEQAQTPALRSFVGTLRTYVKATYANQPDVLADFGISPKAKTPLTAQAKTAAVAKRLATRGARHTLGAQQKKSIKGDVTGIQVTLNRAAPAQSATAPNGASPPTSIATATTATPATAAPGANPPATH